MVAISEARATHSSPLGKNQCVDQSSAALYIFQCGVFYKFKSASSTGVAQPQKCNLFTNRKIAKVYKSMIKVQGFAACFSEFCWVLLSFAGQVCQIFASSGEPDAVPSIGSASASRPSFSKKLGDLRTPGWHQWHQVFWQVPLSHQKSPFISHL